MSRSKTSNSKQNSDSKSKQVHADYIRQTSAWAVLGFGAAMLLALCLPLGRFDLGGALPVKLHEFIALACGWLAWTMVPLLMGYLSWIRFRQIKPEVFIVRLIASAILLLALAGALHIFVDNESASQAAQDGKYGGYIGWGVAFSLGFLHDILSFIVLLIIILSISLVIFDVNFKDVWNLIKSWLFKDKPALSTVKSVPDKPHKSALKLNQAVPVETAKTGKKSIPKIKPAKALIVPTDPNWQFPTIDILIAAQDTADAGDVQANAETIRETLANFSIDVEMEGANVGPRVTQYTLKPPSGIKLAKIVGLESNIALDLAASSIRMEAPIPGKKAVGIEVPNKKSATVRLRNLFESPQWQNIEPHQLAFCIGQDISGKPEIAYLTKMPHILLAGQTGSGKSVGINILLTSLLYAHSPADLRLILVDPKQVELGLYNDIPHLLTPVITAPEKCVSALKWAVAEMERRLKTFAKFSKRNIAEYNALKDQESMPFIVIIIDELADLMMVASRDVESLIVRIAQKARAAGIHLVLATQRPSVNVITGLIKANIPARLAFTVASQIDSRTILDQAGAEKLLGSGDILFMHPSYPKPKRLQGAFLTDKETEAVCDFLREQREVIYDDEVITQEVQLSGGSASVIDGNSADADDELFIEACQVVIDAGKASTSLLQRRLRVGYARAARLIETLEEQQIIGPADGSRPRAVLIKDLAELDNKDEVDQLAESEFSDEEEEEAVNEDFDEDQPT